MNNFDERYINLGLKIAYYRKKNNLTQEFLAELVEINTNYLSRVESATVAQPVSLKLLFALADVFRIPPSKLLENIDG